MVLCWQDFVFYSYRTLVHLSSVKNGCSYLRRKREIEVILKTITMKVGQIASASKVSREECLWN
jgi:hypothetical protein